ncbi:hypothetical protein BDR26DRAFT_873705 [Obelidium mucronatum]|nr:hypothetical protein BDR26DRAFT_873705 [Obelidium mucronatum]
MVEALLAKINSSLLTRGLDLVSPFIVQTYNAYCLEGTSHMPTLPPLATFNRPSTLALLIANTKELWPKFVAHANSHRKEVEASDNPLDDYVATAVHEAMKDSNTAYEARFTYDTDSKFVHFQRLGHHIGFAFLDQTMFLSVHDEVGPWLAYRAVLVLDIDCPAEDIAWSAIGKPKPTALPAVNPIPELHEKVKEHMDQFFAAAKEYSNRCHENHKFLISARDAATTDRARKFRYSENQIRYHYTKDKSLLWV